MDSSRICKLPVLCAKNRLSQAIANFSDTKQGIEMIPPKNSYVLVNAATDINDLRRTVATLPYGRVVADS